jgi:hypothetical protein
LLVILTVWSFSILPAFAAWSGGGPVVSIRSVSVPTHHPSETGDCPCCASGGCCDSAQQPMEPMEEECPLPCGNGGDPTKCPCRANTTGQVLVYTPIGLSVIPPSPKPVFGPAPSTGAETRDLRPPVPPPRAIA